MARKNEAGRYLLDGLTPEEISGRMGIGLFSVRQDILDPTSEELRTEYPGGVQWPAIRHRVASENSCAPICADLRRSGAREPGAIWREQFVRGAKGRLV